ncbi:hypothetical protein [uncultured Lutibacter sp.]|uniref:hypothetical protein n=1 Tax=uncultured Lutibacter sp. TaxID=437739 RepID=UPI002635D978|nr:hypothetical protein [uncultured Lutibacter sp.]
MKPIKNIEEITKYIIKEAQIESPSEDFLDKVMNSVKLESKLSLTKVYQPLISKSAWLLMITVFFGLSIFMFAGNSENSYVLSKVGVSFFDKITSIKVLENISSINVFKNIHFSSTFTYSFIFFSILVMLQLYFIKNYFNKQNSI